MIYGYIRVSSDKQTVENQRFEINNFCEREKIKIDGWIEETISGTKAYDKRQLGKLLNKVQGDDLIICAELSRLGRNLFMIMEILNICMTKECRVWTIKDNYRLGDDIQSKVLAFAFGLSAEIERNLISQRTKEALARKKAEGVVLGRPKGSKNKKYKLSGKESIINNMLKEGMCKTDIAKQLGISRNLLYSYLNGNCNIVMEVKNDILWYRYIYPKNLTLFAKEKLVAPEISYGGNFSYDLNGQYYSTTKIYGYIKKANCLYSYKFLLGLLNSNLFWFFIQNTGYVLRGGYYTFKTNYVSPFPVPNYEAIDMRQVSMVENIVDDILHCKYELTKDEIASYIKDIDKIIYQLYGLSSEDVKTVNLYATR